jgi:cytosine/uracil/thiamine/allantoin permease
MRKTWHKFAAANIGLVMGILASLWMVPGNTPLWSWLAIAGVFLAMANYLLYKKLKKTTDTESTQNTGRSTVLVWIGFLMFVLDLLFHLFRR